MRLLALAARNLRRHRRRTAISFSALALGLALVIAGRAFVNAQHAMMIEGAVQADLGALAVHRAGHAAAVTQSPLAVDLEDSPALRARILSVPGVRAVAPRIRFGAQWANAEAAPRLPGASAYLSVTALEPALEAAVTPRRAALVRRGRPPSADGEIALGAELARALGAEPGGEAPDALRPALLATDQGGAPNGVLVSLVGVADAALPGDRKVATVPLATAQALLRMEGRVTEYGVAVEDPARAEEVRAALARALGPGFEVLSWRQKLPLLAELHEAQDRVFSAVGLVFLLLVLFGAVNHLLMNVLERTREIGTLLAVGLRRARIGRLFVAEGFLLGLLASLAGGAAGLALTWALDASALTWVLAGTTTPAPLHFFVSPGFLATAVALAVASTTAAAAWPARVASALRPVDALRGGGARR